MVKKIIIFIFTISFTICFFHKPVNAMASIQSDHDDNRIATKVDVDDFSTEVDFNEGISLFIGLKMQSQALGVNRHIKSDFSFYFNKGDKVKVQSLNWSPSNQKVQLGFINVNNGKQYWTTSYTGGSKIGGTFSLGGPSGSYYLAIRSAATNTSSINVIGQFDF